jgi:hypothetical protein
MRGDRQCLKTDAVYRRICCEDLRAVFSILGLMYVLWSTFHVHHSQSYLQ